MLSSVEERKRDFEVWINEVKQYNMNEVPLNDIIRRPL